MPREPSVEDVQQAIDRVFPLKSGLSLVAGPIEDRVADLYPEELEDIERAVARRRHEFATGRQLARQAMAELGLPPAPIRRGERREPLWPAGMVGSITHAEGLAIAAVALAQRLRGVGLDVEIADRVGSELHEKLFVAEELASLAGADARLPGLLFSAKEAGYKATYPLAGRFIGFQEAAVDVDWAAGRFSLRYLGEHEPNRVMETAEGHFLFCGRYVLSLVIIPGDR